MTALPVRTANLPERAVLKAPPGIDSVWLMHLNAELRVSRAHVEAEVERLPKPPPGFSQIEWLELPDQ